VLGHQEAAGVDQQDSFARVFTVDLGGAVCAVHAGAHHNRREWPSRVAGGLLPGAADKPTKRIDRERGVLHLHLQTGRNKLR
jgi:hypothetical protein